MIEMIIVITMSDNSNNDGCNNSNYSGDDARDPPVI